MLRLERFLLADEQSFVPRSLALVDRTYRHRGPPPPRPPRRSIASVSFIPTEQSGSPKKVIATGYFWREAAARRNVRSWKCRGKADFPL